MRELRICIDVPDLDAAIAFYTRALGLRLGRRNGALWAEPLGAGCPVDLLPVEAGSQATPAAAAVRDYARHWTPVHLDLPVQDPGDPFGHGFCLLQFEGRGYDELLG